MTMTKTFAAALMASTLLAAPALAQSNPPAQPSPPPAAQPTPPPANRPATTMQQPAAPAATVQSTDQWRASKLVGVNVYNNNNEKVGDIKELITGKDGQIDLVVIGVGGFLGMGEHNVAMKWNQVKFVDQPVQASTTTSSNTGARPNTTGTGTTTTTTTRATTRDYPDHVVVNMTKDQLKAMPEFKYASDSSRTETRTDTTKK
jgi:sporulation protein YlmC with PRC-barrel domain